MRIFKCEIVTVLRFNLLEYYFRGHVLCNHVIRSNDFCFKFVVVVVNATFYAALKQLRREMVTSIRIFYRISESTFLHCFMEFDKRQRKYFQLCHCKRHSLQNTWSDLRIILKLMMKTNSRSIKDLKDKDLNFCNPMKCVVLHSDLRQESNRLYTNTKLIQVFSTFSV